MIDHQNLITSQNISASYGPRTSSNANSSDYTIAVALNFDSKGEQLTRRVAGDKHIPIRFDEDPAKVGYEVGDYLSKDDRALVLNIAGNSLHTFKKINPIIDQDAINKWMYLFLSEVTAKASVKMIISGGQTGSDVAGLIAGLALGLKVHGHYPQGYLMRDANGVDAKYPETAVRARILERAEKLQAQFSVLHEAQSSESPAP
jgi:hypothetical protein